MEIALKLSVRITVGGRSLIRATAAGYGLTRLDLELYSCTSM